MNEIPFDPEHHYGLSEDRFAELQAAYEEASAVGHLRWEATPLGLVIVPGADLEHARIVAGLRDRLKELAGTREVLNDLEFTVGGGFARIPDLVVLDPERRGGFERGRMTSCAGVGLFVEVTSPSTRTVDLGINDETGFLGPGKPRLYADAGVPVYAVVDRKEALFVVFSEPETGGYRVRVAEPIGKLVVVPGIGEVETAFIADLL